MESSYDIIFFFILLIISSNITVNFV